MPRFAHFVSCYASPFFLSGVLSLLLNVRQPPHSCLLTHFLRYDLTKRSQLLIAPITFHQSNQLPHPPPPPPASFLFSLRFSTLLRFCFFFPATTAQTGKKVAALPSSRLSNIMLAKKHRERPRWNSSGTLPATDSAAAQDWHDEPWDRLSLPMFKPASGSQTRASMKESTLQPSRPKTLPFMWSTL